MSPAASRPATRARGRWTREWTAIAVGTGLLALSVVLFLAGDGVQVLPSDITGPRREGSWVWLLAAFLALLSISPAVAYLSRSPAWLARGIGGLAAAVVSAYGLAVVLPDLFQTVPGVAAYLVGVAGSVALRHEHRIELAARATAVIALTVVAWALGDSAVVTPAPFLTLPALGLADHLAARLPDR